MREKLFKKMLEDDDAQKLEDTCRTIPRLLVNKCMPNLRDLTPEEREIWDMIRVMVMEIGLVTEEGTNRT
jgi:hypothetical protein